MERRNSQSGNNSEKNWIKRQNVETTKVFTPMISDASEYCKINKEMAIPLIEKVAAENEFLANETGKIANQMGKVASLGEYLVAENMRMRMHYTERSHDVQNLIKSMEMNLAMETNDIQHQIHLLKESNCICFKSIQHSKSIMEEQNESIEQVNKKLLKLKQENTLNNEKILNPLKVRLTNKLNSHNIEKLKRELEDITYSENELLDEVLDLSVRTKKLETQLNAQKQKALEEHSENRNDKDQYKHNIVHALKSLSELKEELEGLESSIKRQTELNMELRDKNGRLAMRFRELLAEKEKKSILLSQLKFDREKQINITNENKKKVSEQEVKRLKCNEEKEAIIRQVREKKKQMEEAHRRQQAQKQKVENEQNLKINDFKKKMQVCENNGKLEIEDIRTQSSETDQALLLLRDEERYLSGDLENYQQMMDKLENPVSEIERAQLMLRLKGNRGGIFRSISNKL